MPANDFADVYCIDFEASGLEPTAYPIEVAVANLASGEVRSWLIKPTRQWLTCGFWSIESAAIHGITQQELNEHGIDAAQVAAELADTIGSGRVLSDAVRFDGKWLFDLFQVVSRDPPFALESIRGFALVTAPRIQYRHRLLDVIFSQAHTRYPQLHRAAPDAQRNAEILRLMIEHERLDTTDPLTIDILPSYLRSSS